MKIVGKTKGTERGMALIVVLLVIALFVGMTFTFVTSMGVEMRLARYSNSSAQMEWLGRSGMELARYVLSMQTKVPGANSYEALNQKWAGGQGVTNDILADVNMENVQLGGGSFTVKITDMERKFNINTADQILLQQALNLEGVEASDYSVMIDSIMDWRDRTVDPRPNGAKNGYYLGLSPPYYCKNGYLDDISELLLVKGITPEVFWGPRATNHFISTYQTAKTRRANERRPVSFPFGLYDVFNTLSSGQLNLNTAPAATLMLIPGMDDNIAQEIIKFRAGLDGVDGTPDDMPFTSMGVLSAVPGIRPDLVGQLGRYCNVRSSSFDVAVTVTMDGLQRTFHGILTRKRNNSTIQDFDLAQFYWD